jgi:hypothetical protein
MIADFNAEKYKEGMGARAGGLVEATNPYDRLSEPEAFFSWKLGWIDQNNYYQEQQKGKIK